MFGIQLEFLWCTYIPHMDMVTLRRCPCPSGRNLTASPNVDMKQLQVQLWKIDSSQMTVIILPFVVTTPKFWQVSHIMLILIFGCCHLHLFSSLSSFWLPVQPWMSIPSFCFSRFRRRDDLTETNYNEVLTLMAATQSNEAAGSVGQHRYKWNEMHSPQQWPYKSY